MATRFPISHETHARMLKIASKRQMNLPELYEFAIKQFVRTNAKFENLDKRYDTSFEQIYLTIDTSKLEKRNEEIPIASASGLAGDGAEDAETLPK